MIRDQKTRPTVVDVATETMVANLAPFPLPAPSSLATRTLRSHPKVSISELREISLYVLLLLQNDQMLLSSRE